MRRRRGARPAGLAVAEDLDERGDAGLGGPSRGDVRVPCAEGHVAYGDGEGALGEGVAEAGVDVVDELDLFPGFVDVGAVGAVAELVDHVDEAFPLEVGVDVPEVAVHLLGGVAEVLVGGDLDGEAEELVFFFGGEGGLRAFVLLWVVGDEAQHDDYAFAEVGAHVVPWDRVVAKS